MTEGSPDSSRARQLHWGADALWAALEPLLPGLSVEVLARAASTNSELLERARIVPPNPSRAGRFDEPGNAAARTGRRHADTQPCLLVAEHQLAGRGRLGRSWRSARGASLTFSLALPLAPRDWSGLSLVVGIALAEQLQPDTAGQPWRLGVKWPNDLWLLGGPAGAPELGLANGRKLGGVLIETLAAGSQRLAVIGVGLNITPIPESPSTDQQTLLACLRELDPLATAPAVLARIALPLVQALKEFERAGFAAFADRYAKLDLLQGQPIVTTDARASHGVARGVNGQGALLVETASGMQAISSGEVSVRPSLA